MILISSVMLGFFIDSILIFSLIDKCWMRMSASASNLLRYFVFVDAYDENPVSYRYVGPKREVLVQLF